MDPTRDGLNWYVYAYNNPLKYVDPTGMWGKEIHYGDEKWGTLRWARDLGFSDKQAHLIASANHGTDFGLLTNPLLLIVGQKYHFNTNPNGIDSRIIVAEQHLDKAIALYNKAMSTKGKGEGLIKWSNNLVASVLEGQAMIHLGKGLHAIQDISAHIDDFVRSTAVLGITIYDHLWKEGKDADKAGSPQAPDKRVLDAEKDTKDYLTRFRTGVGLQ